MVCPPRNPAGHWLQVASSPIWQLPRGAILSTTACHLCSRACWPVRDGAGTPHPGAGPGAAGPSPLSCLPTGAQGRARPWGPQRLRQLSPLRPRGPDPPPHREEQDVVQAAGSPTEDPPPRAGERVQNHHGLKKEEVRDPRSGLALPPRRTPGTTRLLTGAHTLGALTLASPGCKVALLPALSRAMKTHRFPKSPCLGRAGTPPSRRPCRQSSSGSAPELGSFPTTA